MAAPRLHLIANAHIDPVWLWEWEEGAAAAISTFRTAADLCEEFPGFIFNHNEVILYEWVREYEPALFARIQRLVKEGKWHIMGGWYLQPDCNMPSGESLVRNILVGRAYFARHFGVRPTTAMNFDPFGHSRGLVQIMARAGFDSYLICRPLEAECVLPANEFEWVGFDGSRIRVARSPEWYNSGLGKAAGKVKNWLDKNPETARWFILWGVGDHGGGPSRQDLRALAQLMSETKTHQIVHSAPETYFAESIASGKRVPEVQRDLNLCFPGCYISMVRIKQKHRLLENELYSTEKMLSAAALHGLLAYPHADLAEAQRDLLFGEFHDILPGSSIQPVEEGALRLLSHGLEIISRVKGRAFFALASGQKKAEAGEIPVLAYNPHPYPVRGVFEVEFQLEDQNWGCVHTDIALFANGKRVPAQVEQEESNLTIDWRKHLVFSAELPPSQMARFDARPVPMDKEPQPELQPRGGVIAFKGKDLEVRINTRTGLVDRLRVRGKDVAGGGAFSPVVYEDIADSWGSNLHGWRKRVGTFKCMSAPRAARFAGVVARTLPAVRVTEDGAARTVVEAFLEYADSTACVRYLLPKHGTEFEVELRVLWNEKDRILKLAVPLAAGVAKGAKFLGQTAFGVQDLPAAGTAAVAQKWVSVGGPNLTFSAVNDGVYGSNYDARTRTLELVALRSPAYSALDLGRPLLPENRFRPRQDQGERLFRFWFNAGPTSQRLAAIDREALAHNEKPMVVSFFPSGQGTPLTPGVTLSDDVVQLSALKHAESGDALIVRLFNPTPRPRKTVLTLGGWSIPVTLAKFEIKTLSLDIANRAATALNLVQEAL